MSIDITIIIIFNDDRTARGFVFSRLISVLVGSHGSIFPLARLADPSGCTYRRMLLGAGIEGQCVEGRRARTQEPLFLRLSFIRHIP